MAKTLHELHFELVGQDAQLDVDKEHAETWIKGFRRELENTDVGLFYFAGHGVQIRDVNYLLPVDANPTRESDAESQFLDANWVMQQMQEVKPKLGLLIFDATSATTSDNGIYRKQ